MAGNDFTTGSQMPPDIGIGERVIDNKAAKQEGAHAPPQLSAHCGDFHSRDLQLPAAAQGLFTGLFDMVRDRSVEQGSGVGEVRPGCQSLARKIGRTAKVVYPIGCIGKPIE